MHSRIASRTVHSRFRLQVPSVARLSISNRQASTFNASLHELLHAISVWDANRVWHSFSHLKTHDRLHKIGEHSFQSLSAYVASAATRQRNPNWSQLEDMAFYTAVQGYSEGLLACFKHHLARDAPKELLSAYARLRKLSPPSAPIPGQEELPPQDDQPESIVSETPYILPPKGDSMEMLLCAIVACAMLDSFELALRISIESPFKLPIDPAMTFMKGLSIFDRRQELGVRVAQYIRGLHTARLVARPPSLEKHVRNITRDNNVASLSDLWSRIVQGMRGPYPWLQPHTEMQAIRPVVLCESAWSLFISSFLRLRRPDLAKAVWEMSEQFHVTPSKGMWDSLLDYYCRQGSFEEASAIWSRLRNSSVEPTATSYAAILEALWRTKKKTKAVALFNELMASHELPRDTLLPVCNSQLAKYYSIGELEAAVKLVKSMIEHGPSPTSETYNVTLHHYKSVADLRNVSSTLRDMAIAGVAPDVASFTIVLDALMRADRTDAVEKLLRLMSALGVESNAITCSSIIDNLIRKRDLHSLKMASDMLLEMESPHSGLVPPNEVIYTQLIEGFIRCPEVAAEEVWVAVDELLERMTKRKVLPNAVTYEILYKGAFSHKNAKLAMSYVQRQIQQGIHFGDNVGCILLEGFLQLQETNYSDQILGVLEQAIPKKSLQLQAFISQARQHS